MHSTRAVASTAFLAPHYTHDDPLMQVRNDILDWHSDHPHTNFHGLYDALRDAGYYLEILGSPYTCFNASQARSNSVCFCHSCLNASLPCHP